MLQFAFMGTAIIPLLVTLAESIMESATRPAMEVLPADLTGMHAVVTGGCGAIGLELAVMLAKSAAGVIIACHGVNTAESDQVESYLVGFPARVAHPSPQPFR